MCLYRSLLGDAGLHVVGAEAGASLDMHDLQQVLSDKMHLDADAAASFVAGLRLYMDDDPYRVPPPPPHTHIHTESNVAVQMRMASRAIHSFKPPIPPLTLQPSQRLHVVADQKASVAGANSQHWGQPLWHPLFFNRKCKSQEPGPPPPPSLPG